MVYDDEGKLIPMDLCGVFTGKSIEEAKQKAADEFEVRIDQITFRVVNDVKKGLFGKIKEEAKVWAGYNHPVIAEVTVIDSIKAENKLKEQIETCRRYLQNIMEKMGIEAEINIADSEEGFFVDIDSNGSGAIIGRRGETLDALQYLTSLVVNKMDGEYKRITLDSCGYREKREETLIQLAEKISNKASKILPYAQVYPSISETFLPLNGLKNLSHIFIASSPEILITEIPPGASGVAIAAIIDIFISPDFPNNI